MAYATIDDMYNLGLSAQAFVVRARPISAADVDPATGVIRLEAHGLHTSDIITARLTTGGTLPTALSAFVAYMVQVLSADLFRILDPATGLPITSYALAGGGWSLAVDPARRLALHLEDAAATIDDKMTAHAPPFAPHPLLRGLNARLAAISAVTSLQFENAAHRVAVDTLKDRIEQDWKNLETYLAGRPLRPQVADQTAIPDNGAIAACGVPIVWQVGYL